MHVAPLVVNVHCRENHLALQLMCKQHEKRDTPGGMKSLPIVQRELEHLEDYFIYSQEIDSNENCIVLTCSLGKERLNNLLIVFGLQLYIIH